VHLELLFTAWVKIIQCLFTCISEEGEENKCCMLKQPGGGDVNMLISSKYLVDTWFTILVFEPRNKRKDACSSNVMQSEPDIPLCVSAVSLELGME
jgi:hypothetical protein